MSKRVLMCPPTHFEVAYEINDWMHINDPVDPKLAASQWQKLRQTYADLGFEVEEIEPVKGLPDMVFTANGALVIDGKVFLPRFKYKERQGETPKFKAWFEQRGYDDIYMPKDNSEGEGDALYAGGVIFAGFGFRSSRASHSEMANFFRKDVVSLRLVDPRFYHLDTAMCPIDDSTLMYYPPAFDRASREALEHHFSKRIVASEEDAAGFGLNGVSDGRNVVISAAAKGLIKELKKHGYNPIGRDMTEFRKSGGAVKCCTLELR